MRFSNLLRLPDSAEDANAGFSLSPECIRDVLQHARPLGHHEHPQQLNLGFGFLYYALVRMLRPKHVVVIGSGFGFSVVCLALGLKDNAKGQLSFVDPSYSVLTDGPFRTVGGTSHWSSDRKVQRHFARCGGASAYLLLHDTNIDLRELVRHAGVKRWLKTVSRKKDAFEVVDFPLSSGVEIVRVLANDAWTSLTSC